MQPEDRLEADFTEVGIEIADITAGIINAQAVQPIWPQLLSPRPNHRPDGNPRTLAHPEIPTSSSTEPTHYRLLDGDEQLFSRVRALVVPGRARQ